MDIPAALQKIVEGSDLSQAEAAAVFHSIMSAMRPLHRLVPYWQHCGLKVKRRRNRRCGDHHARLPPKVGVDLPYLVDTCGTGGSGL